MVDKKDTTEEKKAKSIGEDIDAIIERVALRRDESDSMRRLCSYLGLARKESAAAER